MSPYKTWIKHHASKKSDTLEVDPAKFGKSFAKWWAAIQPSWRRVAENGELSRTVPPDGEKWEGLAKGGAAGICVIVVALSWWIKALGDNPAGNGDSWVAVRDLGWVLVQMRTTLMSKTEVQGSKRVRDELNQGVQNGKTKRYSYFPILSIYGF